MTETTMPPETVSSRLVQLARSRPNAIAYRYVESLETSRPITYAEIDVSARRIAGALREAVGEGAPVPICVGAGLGFLEAFFGCLYARVSPVPLPSPTALFGQAARRDRTASAIDACRPSLVIADEPTRSALEGLLTTGSADRPAAPSARTPRIVTLAELDRASPGERREEATPDGTAFVQFSSGSTRDPRGIVVTHANLSANQAMLQEAFRLGDTDVIGGWLPHHHDMGLVGLFMTAIFRGIPCVFSSPDFFGRKPARWLQMIAAYGITGSGAPNFAYDLCVRTAKAEDLVEVDLGAWKIAFNASDMVRSRTLRDFAARFREFGFSPNAFLPCYGMAEATLFVSGARRGEGARAERIAGSEDIVSSGRVASNETVIVKELDGTRHVADGVAGEICVDGAHIARTHLSAEGVVPLPRDEEGLYRTGDVGLLRDGELYVLGRVQNRVKVYGRLVHAEDIEGVLEPLPALQGHRGLVVFADGDALCVAVELPARANVPERQAEIWSDVAHAVAASFGHADSRVLFLPFGSISLTSSGKIRRQKLVADLADGAVRPVFVGDRGSVQTLLGGRADGSAREAGARAGRTPWLRSFLVAKVAEILGVDVRRIDTSAKFTDLGLDSMSATRLIGELEERLGRKVPRSLVWDHPTIDDVVTHLEKQP